MGQKIRIIKITPKNRKRTKRNITIARVKQKKAVRS